MLPLKSRNKNGKNMRDLEGQEQGQDDNEEEGAAAIIQQKICQMCGTTTTCKWRCQGRLCNSCGQKKAKAAFVGKESAVKKTLQPRQQLVESAPSNSANGFEPGPSRSQPQWPLQVGLVEATGGLPSPCSLSCRTPPPDILLHAS